MSKYSESKYPEWVIENEIVPLYDEYVKLKEIFNETTKKYWILIMFDHTIILYDEDTFNNKIKEINNIALVYTGSKLTLSGMMLKIGQETIYLSEHKYQILKKHSETISGIPPGLFKNTYIIPLSDNYTKQQYDLYLDFLFSNESNRLNTFSSSDFNKIKTIADYMCDDYTNLCIQVHSDVLSDKDYIQDYSENGELQKLKYLQKIHKISEKSIKEVENRALRLACFNGHLDVVKYLHTAFGLTAFDARSLDNSALRLACENGHIEVVKYLHTAFRLTADDARSNNALKWACENGHIEVVRYLHTGFGLTADDTRSENNRALIYACNNGHLEVVKYLHKNLGLTTDDARKKSWDGSYILHKACEKGHIDIVKYLHTGFGLTAIDASWQTPFESDEFALRYACEYGHIEVVKYLHTGFGLTPDDARYYSNKSLNLACKNGHLEVVKYLHTGFGLTAKDAGIKDNWKQTYKCIKYLCNN